VANPDTVRKSFLFLQGPSTPFFRQLADRLAEDGHAIHRINFCAGDALYWGRRKALGFRGDVASLPAFLGDIYRSHGITDQILFGDRRPVHRPAVELGKARGVRTHVFEGGYFRPWWITLERDGVNAHSLLPRDPHWHRERGARLAEPPVAVRFASPFREHAFDYAVYHLAGLANALWFSRYQRHLPFSVMVELAGFARRFSRLRLIRRRELRRAEEIAWSRRPYFLLPLQTNADSQIVHHSSFADMGEVIEHVLESFARHAPADTRIVIKNHPLDEGLMDYPAIIRECARRYDLADRAEYLEDGNMPLLVEKAQGMVTVNSTAGIQALELGTPTLTLSDPVYNLPGLTSQSGIDAFWRERARPERDLFNHFRRCVMHATQINGGFYSGAGIALAAENSASVLAAERSPLECLL